MTDLLQKAITHLERNQVAEAQVVLTDHLRSATADARALFLLGTTYLRLGNNGLGIALLKQSLVLRPGSPEAVENLGIAYHTIRDNAQAEAYFRLALEMTDVPSDRSDIYCNLAGLHVNNGDARPGLPLVEQSLAIDPKNYSAQSNKGLLLLELGQWREGWQLWEAAFKTGDRNHRHYDGLPKWDGGKGQHVIIYGDQGVGDEIMYGSMLPDLIADCAHVTFDCHPRLVETWRRSFPQMTVHPTRKSTFFDWYKTCGATHSFGLSSLGLYYRNELSDFPGTPYLKAKVTRLEHKRPCIGISWRGGVPATHSDKRSMELKDMLPLFRTIDADWVSLQYTDEAAKEVCELEEATGIRIKHFPGLVQCRDYDKTVGFVAGLDLVISVCNTLVHTAGALGVPCWCLTPSKPGWRYAGETMPWYGSVDLVKQTMGEPWSRVIRWAADMLQERFREAA